MKKAESKKSMEPKKPMKRTLGKFSGGHQAIGSHEGRMMMMDCKK